jgi:hypothetical protein
MTIRKFAVAALTDGSGNATVYSPYLSGYIHSIQYVKTDYTDGVDFTITVDGTGETVWTESNVNAAVVKAVRQPTYTTAGVASLYASGGVAVQDKLAVGRDRIKIAIAQGGAAHTGTFNILVDDGV